jgi:hypothetical protein
VIKSIAIGAYKNIFHVLETRPGTTDTLKYMQNGRKRSDFVDKELIPDAGNSIQG